MSHQSHTESAYSFEPFFSDPCQCRPLVSACSKYSHQMRVEEFISCPDFFSISLRNQSNSDNSISSQIYRAVTDIVTNLQDSTTESGLESEPSIKLSRSDSVETEKHTEECSESPKSASKPEVTPSSQDQGENNRAVVNEGSDPSKWISEEGPRYRERKDVITKTLLRSIRRFFCYGLSKLVPSEGQDLSNCQSVPEATLESLEEYVRTIIMNLVEVTQSTEDSKQVIDQLVGFVIRLICKYYKISKDLKDQA